MIDKLNIGAGKWSLKGWATLDNPHSHYEKKGWPMDPTIVHDLTSMKPIPLESDTVKLAFSSHLIEHLFNDQVEYLFDEVFRILQPEGIFRVTCPDITYQILAYRTKNLTAKDFVKRFAGGQELGDKFTEEEMEKIIQSCEPEYCLDYFTKLVSRDVNSRTPGTHVNWFDERKLRMMLHASGFMNVRKAVRGDSAAEEMQDLKHFDYSNWQDSLFVEAIK